MKNFKGFDSAFKWAKEVVEETSEKSLSTLTEQIYKDSDKYTFRDTGAMFGSGVRDSDFDKGIIIERAPQVRKLYYDPKITPRGNKMAVPQWFEVTVKENKETYKKIISKLFKDSKGV